MKAVNVHTNLLFAQGKKCPYVVSKDLITTRKRFHLQHYSKEHHSISDKQHDLTPSPPTAPHLEVDDHGEDDERGEQVHQVGQVLAVEGLPQRAHLVLPRGQEVEQRDDGALELRAAPCGGGGCEKVRWIGGWMNKCGDKLMNGLLACHMLSASMLATDGGFKS